MILDSMINRYVGVSYVYLTIKFTIKLFIFVSWTTEFKTNKFPNNENYRMAFIWLISIGYDIN